MSITTITAIVAAAAGLSIGGLLGIAVSHLAQRRRAAFLRRFDRGGDLWKP